MFPALRRIFVTGIVVAISVGIISASIPSSIIQVFGQSAQTTDIFTGQFIPAYLGAAYDPTEAYKQMAGATVYVFAYDTWGEIVNNFAVRTQVRADGSFQAAGLPNASHYGIYFPDEYSGGGVNSNIPFRAPKDSDNLKATFAYQQAYTTSGSCRSPKIQIDGQYLDGDKGNPNLCAKPRKYDDETGTQNSGQPVFLTSSRTVDIANHVNIFPLVPTSILSFIVRDTNAGLLANSDVANYNTPYEVYAQRVVSTNTNTPGGGGNDGDQEPITTNLIVDGPVIRGRTISYKPVDGTGDGAGWATIFQAYAPKGVYAITYWRPNGASEVTYRNYDGSRDLNALFNGVGFEAVNLEKQGDKGTFDWGTLSNRPVTGTNNAWDSKPGSVNVWGLVKYQQNGALRTVAERPVISAGNEGLTLVDLDNRRCDSASKPTKAGNVSVAYDFEKLSKYGIYLFTSGCTRSGIQNANISTSIDVGAFRLAGSNGTSFQSTSGERVYATSINGPRRFDIGATVAGGSSGVKGQFKDNYGLPLQFRTLDLSIDGHLVQNVTKTDDSGRFLIPGGYFSSFDRNKKYTILLHDDAGNGHTVLGATNKTLVFELDSFSLHNPVLAMNSLGVIPADGGISPTGRWLAGLNLSSFLAKLRIPTAFAQNAPEDGNDYESGGFDPQNMIFWINRSSIASFEKYFTPANYQWTKLEINAPNDASFISNPENYIVFSSYAGKNDNEQLKSLITSEMVEDNEDLIPYTGTIKTDGEASSNSNIVAVRLKEKDDGIDWTLGQIMKRYYQQKGSSGPIAFTLNATFELVGNNDDKLATKTDGTTVPAGTSLPSSLSISTPIYFTTINAPLGADDSSFWGDYSHFQVSYVTLPAKMEAPGCDDSSGTWWKPWTKISQVWSNVKAIPCNLVVGGIHLVEKVVGWMADNIFTVDPMGKFPVVTNIWNIMRNLVNSLAVLLLLLAGVAIMLRYEPKQFSLQAALRKLIITIVLVNFSILILQLGIDIANVLSLGGYHFIVDTLKSINGFEGGNSRGMFGAGVGLAALATYIFVLAVATGGSAAIGIILGILGIVVLMAYVLFKAFFAYAFRYVVIILCVALAPLAFAARALPNTEQYFKRWKNIFVGALVGQVAFSAIIAVAMGLMLNIGRADGSLFNGLLGMLLAIGLFYYSTKAPAQVAAMFGENLAGGLESFAKSGIAKVGQARTNLVKERQRRKTEAEVRKVKGMENYRNLRSKIAGNVKKQITGVTPEDLIKERDAVFADAQRQFKQDKEKSLISKGLLRAEASAKLDEVSEQLEYRMIQAMGGISKGLFEMNRDLVDTGGNADYTNGGKTIMGTDNAEWREAFASSAFFERLGGDDPDGVAARYLAAIHSRPDHAIKNEQEFMEVLADMYGDRTATGEVDYGMAKLTAALAEKGVTFGELQGAHGARGFMLSGAVSAANRIDPSFGASLRAQRNRINRGITPGTDVTVPALPLPPYSATVSAWATSAGFPPLRAPATGIRPGIPTIDVQDWLDDLNIVHMIVDGGGVPTPAEISQYSNAYRRLRSAGYEL